MFRLHLVLLYSIGFMTVAFGQAVPETVKLVERFDPSKPYHVELRTNLSGRLGLLAPVGQTPNPVAVTGASTLIYDERPLAADDDKTNKAIRIYRTVDIQRNIGDREQKAEIRPDVRRMIVLRSEKGKKAPFSPDSSLMWNEIDVVRTDIYSPALVPGILPGKEVKPGDKWAASFAAVVELTEIDTLDEGGLTVELVSIVTVANRKVARLSIAGTVKGANEDGPNRQKLEGTAYFDLEADRLTYLKLTGVHELLTQKGEVSGRLEGTFTLSRQAATKWTELNDESLRGIDLKPTAENSLLLYDNPDLGIHFLYPRRWRVGVVQGKQVTLDEPQGGGILLTVVPVARVQTGEQYRKEVQTYLLGQKAKVTALGDVRLVSEKPVRLERFSLDAELVSGKVRLEYAVASTADGGVTVAARLPATEAADLQADVDRVLKNLSVVKVVEGKK